MSNPLSPCIHSDYSSRSLRYSQFNRKFCMRSRLIPKGKWFPLSHSYYNERIVFRAIGVLAPEDICMVSFSERAWWPKVTIHGNIDQLIEFVALLTPSHHTTSGYASANLFILVTMLTLQCLVSCQLANTSYAIVRFRRRNVSSGQC